MLLFPVEDNRAKDLAGARPAPPPVLRKLHLKLCVVDGSTAVGGSFNYTEPATLFNDEALLLIGSPHAESDGVDVDAHACAESTTFFRASIDRIASDSEVWAAHKLGLS